MAIGEKSLGTFVKDLMSEAGFVGHFTNHSLRTTTVNRMIDAGLSDGEIMNRTGHRCSTTIAKYRRINERNAAAASNALTLTSQTTTETTESDLRGERTDQILTEKEDIERILSTMSDEDFDEISDAETNLFDISVTQLLGGDLKKTDSSAQTNVTIAPNAEVEFRIVYKS
jgi:hypothetical protein